MIGEGERSLIFYLFFYKLRLASSPQALRDQSIELGPDLQNVLRQSYDYLTIMPKLRSTYDGRLIYKTSYEERKALLLSKSLAKS